MCHLVLMMPIFGLAVFWFWPLAVAGPIYVVIVFFSVLLYLAIMRAMKRTVQTGCEGMVHEKAEVLKHLNPEGLVLVHGEIWKAVSTDFLGKGELAEVLGVDGLTVRVRRWHNRESEGIVQRIPWRNRNKTVDMEVFKCH